MTDAITEMITKFEAAIAENNAAIDNGYGFRRNQHNRNVWRRCNRLRYDWRNACTLILMRRRTPRNPVPSGNRPSYRKDGTETVQAYRHAPSTWLTRCAARTPALLM